MLFNSVHFLIFLPIVWLLYQYMGKKQTILLVVASFYFYMAWNYYFLGLLLFSIVVDYFAALAISNLPAGHPKSKIFLTISLLVNIGFLAYFKYTNFLLGIWNDIGITEFRFPILDIILPVGISFYTFQSMSYTIDVYRGILTARKSFLEFCLYVSFFPQLVAGPIVRASTFFRDLENRLPVDFNVIKSSFVQILSGFTKKVVFADNLAICVDAVFQNPANASCMDTWIAIFAFMWQIYFDFSGYTDIAIGVARLFGFQFDSNFYFPFNVTSISEHWSRWHISFTSWIRDYIFIPLGGSRGSEWLVCRNIFITFLFGGIWHGAGIHFVVWGIWHSAMLITERQYAKTRFREFINQKGGFTYLAISRIFTIFCIAVSVPLFRANNMEDVSVIFQNIFVFGSNLPSPSYFLNYLKLIVILFIGAQLFETFKWKRMIENHKSYTAFILINFILLLCFGVSESKSFIYFAF